MFLESIHLQGFLSFPPDSPPIPLKALNVLIGPNGSGKSNILEVFSVLRAAPSDISMAFRRGGAAAEWLFAGDQRREYATIQCDLASPLWLSSYTHNIALHENAEKISLYGESIADPSISHKALPYKMLEGKAHILPEHTALIQNNDRSQDEYEAISVLTGQSVLSQIKDRMRFPFLAHISGFYEEISILSDWSFGRRSAFRRASETTTISHRLLDDGSNLPVFVNEVLFRKEVELNRAIERFLPRFSGIKTRVFDGSVSLYLVERGLQRPIPASRLSDGTLRFLAIVATLLHPEPPSLLCLEEPELGMHPDAAALLAELLVEASQRMQIIVTTHSDSFLSALTRHDVNVLVTENFGQGTEVTQVDQDQLASWLDEYTLGDLWRIGKIGGNP